MFWTMLRASFLVLDDLPLFGEALWLGQTPAEWEMFYRPPIKSTMPPQLSMLCAAHMGTCQPLMEMSSSEAMHALGQLRRRRRGLKLRWGNHALRRR